MALRHRPTKKSCRVRIHMPPPEMYAYSFILTLVLSSSIFCYELFLHLQLNSLRLEYFLFLKLLAHLTYAMVILLHSWMIIKQKGKIVLTHFNFCLCIGSKVSATVMEVYFMPSVLNKVVRTELHNTGVFSYVFWCAMLITLVDIHAAFVVHDYLNKWESKKKAHVRVCVQTV